MVSSKTADPSLKMRINFYYVWVFCVHACLCTTCITGLKKSHPASWNYSQRWLKASIWVLGIEPRSSGKASEFL